MKDWLLILAFAVLLAVLHPFSAAAQTNVGVLTFGPIPAPFPMPYISGPVDPSNGQANFNSVIQELNNVLTPILPVLATGNTTAPGTSGTVTVGPQNTAGTIPVVVAPGGSASIQLFTQGQFGILEFGSQNAWFPAKGLTQCPGVPQGQQPTLLASYSGNTINGPLLGPGGTVSGHYVTLDWMGRSHYLVTC